MSPSMGTSKTHKAPSKVTGLSLALFPWHVSASKTGALICSYVYFWWMLNGKKMNRFKYSMSRQKLSNNGETWCAMMRTNHFINLMWQFWCIMHSHFMNFHALGLKTENNNNNKNWGLKECELKKRPVVRRWEHSRWVNKIQNQVSKETRGGTRLGSTSLLPSPENSFLCWENTPEVSLLHSSSTWIQFAGQVSSSRCPSGNRASNVNSQTPTWNQSFAQVLSLKREKWKGRCSQEGQTKAAGKCFDSLDTKPFIWGSFEYLEQCTCNTFQSTWMVPNCGSKLIFYKVLSSEVGR